MVFWRELWSRLGLKVWSLDRLAQYLTSLLLILAILAVIFLVYQVVSRTLHRLFARESGLLREARRRTAIPLIDSVLKYVLGFVALIMVLHQLGINYTAILAGAGVVGIAVGFGAQTLVRDLITGFFILFEGLIQVGDFIETDGKSGTVEQIGLRTTHFRAYNGILHTIPNGELTRFGNYNRGFCRAIVEVRLGYERDIQPALTLLNGVARTWAADNQSTVLEPPKVMGLFDFGETGALAKVTVKVKPQTHWEAEQELRRRIKAAFDQAGITIPYPHRVIQVEK